MFNQNVSTLTSEGNGSNYLDLSNRKLSRSFKLLARSLILFNKNMFNAPFIPRFVDLFASIHHRGILQFQTRSTMEYENQVSGKTNSGARILCVTWKRICDEHCFIGPSESVHENTVNVDTVRWRGNLQPDIC